MARPGLMRHKKFARLARLIGNEVLARGHLELLWEVAYENGDDLVGDAGDLEHLTKWAGASGALAAALLESGFVDQEGEQYRVHDLWDHAPDYVRKRRQRENERQEKGATLSRSAATDRTLTGQSPTDGAGRQDSAPNGRPRAPAPAPAPAHNSSAVAKEGQPRLPGKAERLATDYPATQAVLDLLASDGLPMGHAGEAPTRTKVEQLVARMPVARAAEAVKAGHARKGKLFVGWYLEDLAAALRELDAPPLKTLPIIDLAWLDKVPADRRAEAQRRWAEKQAEIERDFTPEAADRLLAANAEAMRQEFMQ